MCVWGGGGGLATEGCAERLWDVRGVPDPENNRLLPEIDHPKFFLLEQKKSPIPLYLLTKFSRLPLMPQST